MARVEVSRSQWLIAAIGLAACSPSEPASPPDPATKGEPTLTIARDTSGSRSGPGAESLSSPRPPPRRGIAGIAGFQSRSRLVFAAKPDEPHELSTIYQFPDRMRMRLSLDRGKIVERVLLYHFGAVGYCIDERESRSRELAGTELSELHLQAEARRALFLWPDGIDWGGDGSARTGVLETIGKLEVELGADGRPVELRSTNVAGETVETFRSITWQKIGSRNFPARFESFTGGERTCTEEVLEVETKLDYVDDFFVPPDRRAASIDRASEAPPAAIEAVDLTAVWELRVPLDPVSASTLGSALAQADAQRAMWKSRGAAPLEETILELDHAARPIAILLHTESARPSSPESWPRRDESPAWILPLQRAQDAERARVADFAERCGIELDHAKVELHVSRAGSPERVTLVMFRR